MVDVGWNDLKIDDVARPTIIEEISRKLFRDLDAKVVSAVGSARLLEFYRTHHLVLETETTEDHRYLIKAHYEPNL